MSITHAYPTDENSQSRYVIEYFMWGYQSHACISITSAAERLFATLSSGLCPTARLIGFLDETHENRHPICIEPEDDHYKPEDFIGVKSIAETFAATKSSRMYIHPSKAVADRFEERDRRSNLRAAVITILNRLGKSSSAKTFCGTVERVEGYLVMPVLELNLAAYESLPRLPLDHQIGDETTFRPSLLDALIEVFLEGCSKYLRQSQPGADFEQVCPDEWDALRSAANSFLYAVSSAGDNFNGLHGLYAALNGIASLRYEGTEGVGRLIVAKRHHQDVFLTLELQDPIDIRNSRAVRKLLELSDSGLALLTDSAQVYGLGRVLSSYNASHQSIFEIELTGHHQWRVLHSGQTLIEVAYDRPQLHNPRIARVHFESIIMRLFPMVARIDLDNLWNLVGAAVEQRQGTMLVISESANTEAVRLVSQSTLVTPLLLTPEIMRLVSKIDGAVLIDPRCNCVAIGVILDGMASASGNPSRGARYNSAIRYVETLSSTKTLAIVVSEDGSVDLIPNLKPQIDPDEITSRLNELSEVNSAEQLDMKRFYQLMKWFSEHRFYLSPDACLKINTTKKEVYKRYQSIDRGVLIIEADFEPNPSMNDEYFLSKKFQNESCG